MPRPFRILSIDGGGVRGLIPAMLLAEIERRTGRSAAGLFDLVAGTSAGGLLALGLTLPHDGRPKYSAAEMVSLFTADSPRIFARTPARVLATLDGLVDEKYPAGSFEDLLHQYFGEARLSEALTDVIVPAYELGRRQAYFFKSRKAKTDPRHDMLVRLAARATTAAPAYFEPLHLDSPQGGLAFVDGGMVANNPVMCAIAEARKHYPQAADILLVSLGTGDAARPIAYAQARDWGLVQWLEPLISIFLDGMSDAAHYEAIQSLPDGPAGRRYYRFQIALGQVDDALDNVSGAGLRALQLLAGDIIRLNNAALDDVCQQLLEA
jgi:patatin-like phospholipase/acyl hydrolase